MSSCGCSECRSIIERGINEGREVFLIGDPDVDGIFSLRFLCDLFDMKGVSYKYHINSGRKHGFTLNPNSLRGSLIVMADFAIDRSIMLSLIKRDCLVVSLDHHEIHDDFVLYENGVIINNQYSFEAEEDRYLSGAGVVYEVFTEVYPEFKSKIREAIVGITLLSDVRAIENDKARKYLRKTYSADDDYTKYLIDCTLKSDYTFGVPRMDRSFVDFTFSPTINALLRFNKTKEAINFILGGGLNTNIDYRVRQQELVREMESCVEVLNMPNVFILAIDSMKFSEDITNFIGLLCSKYKNKGKSSLIFAYESGVVKRASFRGKYDDIDYNSELNKIGVRAEGHKGAFGIKNFHPTKDIWKRLDSIIGELEVDHTDTRVIIKSVNLSSTLLQRGMKIGTDNCYVRDMYRTYIDYVGSSIKEVRHTYRYTLFTDDDYLNMREADGTINGEKYYYERDEQGNKITKYLEYAIDGRTVKSFGATIENGLIMPILEKGYLQLYLIQKGE